MSASSPLFLIGMRASGKTTLGQEFARRIGWKFVDTDEWVVRESGMRDVTAIVESEGWQGFRDRESLALRVAAEARTVVASGGGAVLRPENRRIMRTGLCVYLAADSALLAARLRQDPKTGQRPPLNASSPLGADQIADDVEKNTEIEALVRERDALYREAAHFVLDAGQALPDLLARLEMICSSAESVEPLAPSALGRV